MAISPISHSMHTQFLAAGLIGLGTGGVVGASTMGVAMFTLIAPPGALRQFTAVIPVVNCCANFVTVSEYVRHADFKTCWRMWPFIILGILLGTWLLPLFEERILRRTTSVVYACVLLQQLVDFYLSRRRVAVSRDHKSLDVAEQEEASKRTRDSTIALYRSWPVAALVSVLCGILTVVCNNSGPIFNIYLLSTGLEMDAFVATRAVLMAGKNLAKVSARLFSGGLPLDVLVYGCKLGVASALGIQLAKPIKKRTSASFYKFFTWGVLAYTSFKMWRSSLA